MSQAAERASADHVEATDRRNPPADAEARARVGRRLRRARDARRLTLAQLAAATGLTKGFLSKIERDQATPSVASLLRLCDALELSVGELFADGGDEDLVRAGAYPPIQFGGTDMLEALLTPAREHRLQVLHSRIAPGGGSGDEVYELPIDVGFAFVVEGRLRLTVADRDHDLRAGDALTFAPDRPHAFHNPDDAEDTIVLWVLAPGLPVDREVDPPEIG